MERSTIQRRGSTTKPLPVGSFDDLGLEKGEDAGQGAVKDRPFIGAVGEQFSEKGEQAEQGRQQRKRAVTVLDVGGGDDAVEQQALGIDQTCRCLPLISLPASKPCGSMRSPFSALFTLWLSMMQAVGLPRAAFSRHLT